MGSGNNRIVWIDFARIIAIVLIVGFHLLYALNENQGLRSYGFVGASLFFILSGYMLAFRYPDVTGFDFDWLKKRFVKIVSLYYPALIAMALLFPIDTYYRGPYDLGLHFIFMNWISQDTAYSIISAGWFIVPLIGLYLLFPYLNRFMKKAPYLIFIAFALELANRFMVKDLVSFSPVFFLGEFCFGMIIANGERKWWLLAAALIPAIINPVLLVPFVLFFILSSLAGAVLKLPGPLSLVAGNTFEIFLFHEAAIMVALGRWSLYGQGMLVSLIGLGTAIVLVKLISKRIQRTL